MKAKDLYNISSVETKLYSLFNGVVSNNCFVGTLPSVLEDSWNDICLISIDTDIRDMDAYADGVVSIILYARPLADGTKNVARMSALEVALNGVINSTTDTNFAISRNGMSSDYDTNLNWHCNIITLNLRIY